MLIRVGLGKPTPTHPVLGWYSYNRWAWGGPVEVGLGWALAWAYSGPTVGGPVGVGL